MTNHVYESDKSNIHIVQLNIIFYSFIVYIKLCITLLKEIKQHGFISWVIYKYKVDRENHGLVKLCQDQKLYAKSATICAPESI